MLTAIVVSQKPEQFRELNSSLTSLGLNCSLIQSANGDIDDMPGRDPDLVLIAINGASPGSAFFNLPSKIKKERRLPVIALLSREAMANAGSLAGIDDFVLEPWDAAEVAARAGMTLRRLRNVDSERLVKVGDLEIDLDNCEVTVGGRTIDLTFKEYELLRFLATNRGRAFTRDVLLDKVWGYDYFGGDRTVDVHIRRLRGKIEDASHTFIETVRNIGYRFVR